MQLFLFLLPMISPSYAADPNKPHPHQGVATKFGKPTKTLLTTEETAQIKSGKPILKQVKQGSGGRGIAIMDLNASQEEVWDVITNYKKYPSYIPELKSTENYKVSSSNIYTTFVLKSMMMTVEYYVKHNLYKDGGYITWTLDYSKESDLDDSTGCWFLYPSPDNPGQIRVEYTIDVRISGWVPKFVQNVLAERGLEDATKWVKKAVE
jgi:coenzyme Q-binding protein COQ10